MNCSDSIYVPNWPFKSCTLSEEIEALGFVGILPPFLPLGLVGQPFDLPIKKINDLKEKIHVEKPGKHTHDSGEFQISIADSIKARSTSKMVPISQPKKRNGNRLDKERLKECQKRIKK